MFTHQPGQIGLFAQTWTVGAQSSHPYIRKTAARVSMQIYRAWEMEGGQGSGLYEKE